ncbi:PleD family two-component system response regulator [Hyphomicrobium sulfonivorans]|uniref:diguanylate cyclase n=1 Tax=Hyphomicrobium sulfonivorans TaxID=121290 RepID=A0A109BL56_HYPSL|nr:PleD family two-component system response regulator [Hyphomicrobium sulfonivorans]KWT70535.1 Pole remodelling regulatory diguanylate cyclase [Hyphomicrobium sulfonivorans]MBI1650059.1 PleD family two-component system response regulator [Hyphomicrobium sulfonivorans]NSL72977.1 PleD family two-component system response regulator [Hyphomicrobium sulfonivorans]
MTARVLVVDDISANVKLLEARLSAEYFDVLTASSGPEALDVCERERVDVVLLDVMMPGMDGFEVCRRLKSNPKTHHIPIILVTALDQVSDRVRGLQSGADDFLTKPVDDIALITRVKNLARLKTLTDEMLLRALTGRQLGINEDAALLKALSNEKSRVLIVDDDQRNANRIANWVATIHLPTVVSGPTAALDELSDGEYDLAIISLSLAQADALRLCSQIRSVSRTRHLPIILVVEPGYEARLLRALDMGVNDYIMRPVDENELLARVKTQVRRKRYSDHLRDRLEESIEASVIDALTGLHNRRYMETHLTTLVEEARRTGRALSVLLADIDHFKHVNDTYGHDIGDAVLREFSVRFRRNTRGIDLACRYGGEEFLVIMPDTDMSRAFQVGERLRASIASDVFQVSPACSINLTASVGLATLECGDDTPETVFRRADQALFVAKRAGRNRVEANAA